MKVIKFNVSKGKYLIKYLLDSNKIKGPNKIITWWITPSISTGTIKSALLIG